MASGYIPDKQEDQATWALNFTTKITASPTTYGLIAGDATAIAAAVNPFLAALTVATTPATRTAVTVNTKDTTRANMLAVCRSYSQQIVKNPGVTDANKIALGLNPGGTGPTPIPAPVTEPILGLIKMTHLSGQFRSSDSATPDIRAKPFGAVAMELWRFIGTTTPVGPEDATFVGLVTKQPFTQSFDAADVTKKVWCWGRWVTRTGEVGPWSTALQSIII